MAMRKITKMFYHKGIMVKIYPSEEQRRIIAVNDGASRVIYNQLVDRDKR